MTLIDITNQLIGTIELLEDEDILNEDNLSDLIEVPAQFQDDLPKLISIGLKELESQGMIVKVDNKKWILKQPLSATGQNVDISMITCNEIAEVINSFLDARGAKGQRADKLNISESEIAMLISILNEVMVNDPGEDEDFEKNKE